MALSQRSKTNDIVLALLLLLLHLQLLFAAPFPRSLTNFLLSLREGPANPPKLSDLSHFRSFSCSSRQDGAYPDLQSSCTAYYRCLGGSTYSYVCPDRQKFDQEDQECKPAKSVTCPTSYPYTRKCRNQTDGFYPDYFNDCKSYYRCNDGEVAGSGRCERGALWDFATASCGSGLRASCSPPSCWGLPDGPHPVPGSGCTAYFICKDGVRTDNVCPSGTIFDYMEKVCVSTSRSVCYERVCEGRQNGAHAMPQAPCHAYFRCFNAALVQVEVCPPRYIFDGWECIQPANFSCWSDSNGSCSRRPDGIYAGDDKDCRGFFLCRQERLVRSFKCSSGFVFNGKKCVDSQNFICASRPKIPDCKNKLDGYYTTDKSDCRSFYYCRHGVKQSDHTCPGSNVFNGQQCVDPLAYSCLAKSFDVAEAPRRTRFRRDASCSGTKSGFIVDENSNCNRFYQCKNGRNVSIHACPKSTVFNGYRCVSNKEFTCSTDIHIDVCRGAKDGVYSIADDCRLSVECSNGKQISTRKCADDEHFDVDRCSKDPILRCPSHSWCKNRLNGTFEDLAAGCKTSFFCQDGFLVRFKGCRSV